MSTTKRKRTVILPDGTTDHRTTARDYTHVVACARRVDAALSHAENVVASTCRRLAQQTAAKDAGGELPTGNGCSVLYSAAYVATLQRDLARYEADVERLSALPQDGLLWFAYSWHGSEALAAKAMSNLGTWAARQVCEVTA